MLRKSKFRTSLHGRAKISLTFVFTVEVSDGPKDGQNGEEGVVKGQEMMGSFLLQL